MTNDERIVEYKNTHGHRYLYSKTKYIDAKTPIIITCRIHGDFEQKSRSHKNGAGCIKCGNISSKRKRKLSKEKIIDQFKNIHGNKYDYSLFNYKGDKIKSIIICKEHGEFEQVSSHHKQGVGCPRCSGKNLDTEIVVSQFKKVHGDLFNYSKVRYVNDIEYVEIICKEHGSFKQSPTHHKQGNGCPKCSHYGFNVGKPGLLYYIRIDKDGHSLYKIGVTNRTLKERFLKDMQYITPLRVLYYDDGEECLKNETFIKKEFEYAQWSGKDLLNSGGNTELFKYDILNLDY